MLNDIRFALRSLWKSPGFAIVSAWTLALGIGANTAIFSLIDGIFLRGLTFARPAELYRLHSEAPERNLQQLPASITKYEHFRDQQTVFTGVAADSFAAYTLTGLGDPEQLNAFRSTSNYFELLGVTPVKGRLFLPAEESAGGHVTIVSERFWKGRLNGDPDVIGRMLTLDGVAHEIVGVVPEQPRVFFGPADLWTTRPFEGAGVTPELKARGFSFLRMIARAKPGVSAAQVQQAVNALSSSYLESNREKADSTWRGLAVPLSKDTLGDLREPMWLLFGAVALVLLIACSNVANLLLVRFTARRRETAVRLSLGAERGRLIRLFLVESITISLIAAAMGAAIAQAGLRWLPALDAGLPLDDSIELNPLVLAFTLGIAVLTGVITGLYPSLQAARPEVVGALKDGGRGTSTGLGQRRFRTVALGAQVALSFVLLAGAFLLLVSFTRLYRQSPGFDPDRVLITRISLPAIRYASGAEQQIFRDRLLEALRRTPGVKYAAAGIGVPLTGFAVRGPYSRADKVVPFQERPLGYMRFISTDYLATLGIAVKAGREFLETDRAASPYVILISESTARRLFPEGNALGQHMLIGSLNNGIDSEIVGVVADVRSVSLAEETAIEIYRPFTQRPGNDGNFQLIVQPSGADPTVLAPALRKTVQAIDEWLPVAEPRLMSATVASSIAPQKLLMMLVGLFAALALVLAVVGIYSVVAHVVGQRTAEIGVRLALGARPSDVATMVLRQGMLPVAVGMVAGLAAALGLGRFIQGQLFGTTAFDPTSFAITFASLVIPAIAACWIPARRAARIGPAIVLRG